MKCPDCGTEYTTGVHHDTWRDCITSLRAQLDEARQSLEERLRADNGETWEDECMRARAQRDEARSDAHTAYDSARYEKGRADLAERRLNIARQLMNAEQDRQYDEVLEELGIAAIEQVKS